MNEEAIKELKEELKEIITWLAITINKEEMYERKERRKRAIEAALIALEQTKWIPVSERLPKDTGWYLITFKTANGVAVCELSYRKPENYWTDKDISKKVLDNNDILAWMPLPEPYKEKQDGKNNTDND